MRSYSPRTVIFLRVRPLKITKFFVERKHAEKTFADNEKLYWNSKSFSCLAAVEEA